MNIIQNFPKYSGVALKVPFQHLFEKNSNCYKRGQRCNEISTHILVKFGLRRGEAILDRDTCNAYLGIAFLLEKSF